MIQSRKNRLVFRLATTVGAFGVVATILTGCGAASNSPGPAANDSTSKVTTSNPKLDSFLKKAAEPYKGTTVNVLAISSAQADAIKQLSGQFTKLTGINVTFTSLSENDAITKASVTLSSKSPGFDVLQDESFFVPSYAKNGWLHSVEDLSKNKTITFPGLDTANYAPAAVNQLKYGGSLWSLPMFVATQVFYYRTDIFKKEGITVPKTLTELVAASKKITDSGTPAIAMRAGIGPTQNVFPWTSWLYNEGGSYFKKYDASTGKYGEPALDSPQSVKAAQLYATTLQKYAPSGSLNWTVADVTRAFLSGQVAMIQEGSPFGGTINDPAKSAVAGKVGAFAVPAGSAGAYYPAAAQGWGISKFSAHAQAAWLFTQWATDPSVLLNASLAAQFPAPPLTTVFKNKAFVKKYDFPGFLDSLQTSLSGKSSPIGGSYIPSLLNWQSVGQNLSVELNKVINNQESASDAMKTANGYLSGASQ